MYICMYVCMYMCILVCTYVYMFGEGQDGELVAKYGLGVRNNRTKSPETQELTVIQQWKDWLATIRDGKLPTNQKIEG